MLQRCERCNCEFYVEISNGGMLTATAVLYCPNCSQRLADGAWPWLLFTYADVLAVLENDAALSGRLARRQLATETVITEFTTTYGKLAEQACGEAVMRALETVWHEFCIHGGYDD